MAFRATPASSWGAMTRWNPDYFSSIKDSKFKVYQSDSPVFTYFSTKTPFYRLLNRPTNITETQMNIAEFFDYSKKGSNYAYFSASLNDFPAKFARDVEPMDWMNVKIGSGVKPSKMVWIGVGGGIFIC